MYLNYSNIDTDIFGRPEIPTLRLETMYGRVIGILSNVSEVKVTIKYAEPSEISFDIAAYSNGVPTPFYDNVVGYKVIYTENYGVYLIMNPTTSGDGIMEVKHVRGYSLEKSFETKSFFLEEGTFNFWNPASPKDTIIGRILEIAPDWHVGYISASLIGRYRTFDQYDNYLLAFITGAAPEKYRCVFTFDTYKKTINAFDIDEPRKKLGIYLDYSNLVNELSVNELSDEVVTAVRAYGADGLSVRDVNPIGTDWQYDLTYFIENGDLPADLAGKWTSWQGSIVANQEQYRGLVAMKASAMAQTMAQRAALTDLQHELDDLTNQQSVTIQALALEITDDGKASQQNKLDEINGKIAKKKKEISDKEAEISKEEDLMGTGSPNSYQSRINAINEKLALEKYFTEDELSILRHFFLEKDVTQNSFVATDVNVKISGKSYSFPGCTVGVANSNIIAIDMTQGYSTQMYTLEGGALKIDGILSCDIIRGTLEVSSDSAYVFSIYGGSISTGGESSTSGVITMTGKLSNLKSDIEQVDTGEPDLPIITHKGTSLSFSSGAVSMYVTANVSEYQAMSVQMELFDYAKNLLDDLAFPTYEFSVDSGNFLFAQDFSRFKNELALGSSVYLRINDRRVITPVLIELTVDFENWDKLSLTFSNRFKLHDTVNNLKDLLQSSYSSSRSLDASKYIYNKTVEQASAASKFMASSLDLAANSIRGAADESVRIDSAGIHVGKADGTHQLRIIGDMLAMTDDNWEHAKLAIGRFSSPEVGEYFGVNADVIGGKLIVGNNLIIENYNADMGVSQFRFDASGAWLNNATLCVQCDAGGKLLIDPRYGLTAGTADLFTVDSNGVVKPSFIAADGTIILDGDGIPQNSNFYLDSRTGKAYFRGDGVFNGTVYATAGEFNGVVKATDFQTPEGTSMMKNGKFDSKYLDLGNIQLDGNTGDITMTGDINMSGASKIDMGSIVIDGATGNINFTGAGSITWGSNTPVKYQFSTSASGPWHNTMGTSDKYRRDSLDGGKTWGSPYQFRGEDGKPGLDGNDADVTRRNIEKALEKASTISESYIAVDSVGSPEIYGGKIYGAQMYANEFNVYPLPDTGGPGSFNLYGNFVGDQYHFLRIEYLDTGTPVVVFESPGGAEALWRFGKVVFDGGWIDFSLADRVDFGKNAPTAKFA